MQLAHARALREEFVQPVRSSRPLYLRKPDAEINWTTRDGVGIVMAAPRCPQPDELDVTIGPMRRRHLRSVLRIEQQVYPRPWSLGLFMSELGYRGSRVYLVARVGTHGRRLRRA